jgi:hypothetical protein
MLLSSWSQAQNLICLQNFLKNGYKLLERKISEEAEIIKSFWKGLRFQLIEGRAMAQSDIKITSLKDYKQM